MKSHINLYRQELRPKLRLLSLPLVLVAWCGVAFVLVLLHIYFSVEQQEVSNKLTSIENTIQQQTQLKDRLQKELEGLTSDPKLKKQLIKKQQSLNLKKRVVIELQGQEKNKSTGFADLMLDLSKDHQQQLWLTRIYLNDTAVTLEGIALDSANIPIWVNSLGDSAYFTGQEFFNAHIYRNEEQLHFTLTTKQSPQNPEVALYE